MSLTLFSAEHGALHAMQRIPKKPSASQVMLDLFDEASLTLESSNQGRSWFVKEARLIVRQTAIGRSYSALQGASTFAKLIARNPVSPDSRPSIAPLLRTAFASFGTASRPEIVTFKCMYLFARDEGYPVKQEWFASLAPADRDVAAQLLNKPLAEQSADATQVARIQRLLEDYLKGHTEIIVD